MVINQMVIERGGTLRGVAHDGTVLRAASHISDERSEVCTAEPTREGIPTGPLI